MLVLILMLVAPALPARGQVTREEVEKAIREGIRYLKEEQQADGSWADYRGGEMPTGTTSLVTLALLTAGEPADEPHVARALEYLRQFTAEQLDRTYTVALQTMVFAAADPQRYRVLISGNVRWLERAQHQPGDRPWPGSWSYTGAKSQRGDNSNSQYALLGLNAASEVGIAVKPEVWTLARAYWEIGQKPDGGWSYLASADSDLSTASMTCAGISSLIITGLRRYEGQESLDGETIRNCGKGGINLSLQRGIDWISGHFHVDQNFRGGDYKFYYLYGLERAGRLTGLRFFGDRDWYREGAEELVHAQERVLGFWQSGGGPEQYPLVATSFALLFLAKGRSPVVINKFRYGAGADWNNDPDDVRNLVDHVSRDWKHLLTWQTVDPKTASTEDLLQAPIAFFNGHRAPVLDDDGVRAVRDFIEQGGFLFAEACCGEPEFDRGFRALMMRVFPESNQSPPQYALRSLTEDHPVWRARFPLSPDVHPLWGIEHGCRTVVIYSPTDLSCFWNQAEAQPTNPAVIRALRVGQNVVDYATGRELPEVKLSKREVHNFKAETPKRGALRIAKLRHAGDWDVAPLSVPNLMVTLRDKLGYDVVLNHRELLASDPAIINYPLIYVHGRAAMSFDEEDLARLRRHLEPGGGTLFADAACGSPAFDAAFRRFVATLLPDNALVPIPADDELYTEKVAYDLSDVQYSRAAGGGKGRPQLEGVRLGGHWAIIYSPYDIGCALERQQGLDCKGYTHESALRIAANIVIYSTLP
jgi:hypothetical protein